MYAQARLFRHFANERIQRTEFAFSGSFSAGVLGMCGYITSLSNLYYFKLALTK